MAITKFTPPTRAQIDRAIERFRDHLYGELNLKPSTIDNYLGVLRRAAPKIGLEFTEADARNYLSMLRQKGDGYAHLTVTAVGVERYLRSIGIICKLPRPSKPGRKEIEPLTEFEVALILWHCETLRQKAMLAVLSYSGIRNLEFCSLQVRDIDIARQSLFVRCGKGGSSREVCISGECIEILAEYLRERNGRPTDWLFVTHRNGNQLEPQDIRKFVRVSARRAGLSDKRVFPHLFRHSLACNLVHNGADVFTIQHQLGHQHLLTTMEYLHPNAQRAATQYHAFAPNYASGQKKANGRVDVVRRVRAGAA